MEYLKVNGVHKQGKIYLYESFDQNRAKEFRKLKGRFYKNKKYWVFPSLTSKNISSSFVDKNSKSIAHINNSISENQCDTKTQEAKVEHSQNLSVESNTNDDGYQEFKQNIEQTSKNINEEEYKSNLDDECKSNSSRHEEEYKSNLDDECKKKEEEIEAVLRKKKEKDKTFVRLGNYKIHTDKKVYRYNPDQLFFDYVKVYKLLLE